MWVLLIALAIGLSTGWFAKLESNDSSLFNSKKDVIEYWEGTIPGTPEEKVFQDLVDEYNRTHKDVYVKAVLMPWASYQSKINIAVATGQPPDVCYNAFIIADGMRAKQKTPDLAVPIPDDILTPKLKAYYGKNCLAAVSRNHKVYLFPSVKFLQGGTFTGNREWFEKAGVDIDYYTEHGWDYDTFRDVMKRVQAVMRKENGPDANAFGLNLLLLNSQFYNGFLASALGRDAQQRGYYVWDKATKKYVVDPAFNEEIVAKPLRLMQQMMQVDGTWVRKNLAMDYSQLRSDLTLKGLLAVTWNDVVGSPVELEIKTNREDLAKGLIKKPIRLCEVPFPTPVKGGRPPVFSANAEGYGVLRQIPAKSKEHVRHALEFAQYMSSPYKQAKVFMVNGRRWHLWIDEPEVLRMAKGVVSDPLDSDPNLKIMWNQYLKWYDSPSVVVPGADEPDMKARQRIGGLAGQFMTTPTQMIIERVLSNSETPEDAAKEIVGAFRKIADDYYAHHKPTPGEPAN